MKAENQELKTKIDRYTPVVLFCNAIAACNTLLISAFLF